MDSKQQTLTQRATVLAVAILFVKALGAFYKVLMVNHMIYETGFAYLTKASNLYMYVLLILTAGVSLAVSKTVAQRVGCHRYRDVQRVFLLCRKHMLRIGLLGTVLLCLLAMPYAHWSRCVNLELCLYVLAPGLFFCCLEAVYQGYFEGLCNMIPTAVTQTAEALVKVCVGCSCSFLLIKRANRFFSQGQCLHFWGYEIHNQEELLPFCAAAAAVGVSIGSFAALLLFAIFYQKYKKGIPATEFINSPCASTDLSLKQEMGKIILPIAIGALVSNIGALADDFTFRAALRKAAMAPGGELQRIYQAAMALGSIEKEQLPDFLYGCYHSVLTIKNLIPGIAAAFGTSAVPVVSCCFARKDKKGLCTAVDTCLRGSMILAFPVGFGLLALSEPVLNLLYYNRPGLVAVANSVLRVYAAGMFLFSLLIPLVNLLQAVGKPEIAVKAMGCVGAIRVLVNICLVSQPKINIYGGCLSSLAGCAGAVGYCYYHLLFCTGVKPHGADFLFKPFLAGGLCGLSAYAGYRFLQLRVENSFITLGISVILGAVVYFFSMILLKGIKKQELFCLTGRKKAKCFLQNR